MNETPDKQMQTADGKKDDNFAAVDWLYCIVVACVAAILLFSFVVRTTVVRGSSMVPTLEERNYVIVNRLYSKPKYGDIIVLRKASFMEDPIIKRVIATEGQTVDIDFAEGIVYVDGQAMDEPYVNSPTLERESFTEPVTVPEGCVFVMGDNRNRSTDSRSAQVGCVDTRLIIGKAFFRIAPLNQIGKI